MLTFTRILVPALVLVHYGTLVALASPLAAAQPQGAPSQPQEASRPGFHRGDVTPQNQTAQDKPAVVEALGKRQIHNADYGANPNSTASSAAPTSSETTKTGNAGQKREYTLPPHSEDASGRNGNVEDGPMSTLD